MSVPLTEAHNKVLLPILRMIVDAAPGEAAQWVVLESLCLGIGMMHGRDGRQCAEFIDTMAQRIATGERT